MRIRQFIIFFSRSQRKGEPSSASGLTRRLRIVNAASITAREPPRLFLCSLQSRSSALASVCLRQASISIFQHRDLHFCFSTPASTYSRQFSIYQLKLRSARFYSPSRPTSNSLYHHTVFTAAASTDIMTGTSLYTQEQVRFVLSARAAKLTRAQIIVVCAKRWHRNHGQKQWDLEAIKYIFTKAKEAQYE